MDFSFSYPIDFKFAYEGTLPPLTSNLRHVPKSLCMNQILFNITAKDVIHLENTCRYFRDLTVKSAFWQHACASRTQPQSDPFVPEIEAITDIYDRSSRYRALFIQRESGQETWRLEHVTDDGRWDPIDEQIEVDGYRKVTLPESQSRVITESLISNFTNFHYWDLTHCLMIEDRIGIVGVVLLKDRVNRFYQSPNGFMVQLATHRNCYVIKPDVNNLIPSLNRRISTLNSESKQRTKAVQARFCEQNQGYKMNFPYPISFKFKHEGELPLSTSKLRYIPNNLWTHYILPNITPKDLTNLENTCCYFRDLVVKNAFWHQACASRTQPHADPFVPEIEAITDIYARSSRYRALFIQRECGHETWQLEHTTETWRLEHTTLIGDPIDENSPGFLKSANILGFSGCVKLPGSRLIGEHFIASNYIASSFSTRFCSGPIASSVKRRLIIADPKGIVADMPIDDKVRNFYPNGVQLETFREYFVLKPDINNLIPDLNKRLGRSEPNKPKLSDSEIACQEHIAWARRMKASVSAPLKFRTKLERDSRRKNSVHWAVCEAFLRPSFM